MDGPNAERFSSSAIVWLVAAAVLAAGFVCGVAAGALAVYLLIH